MIWAGSPFAHLIEFSTGAPTGAISFTLLGNNGSTLLTQSVTPAVGAVSYLFIVAGSHNSCGQPFFEKRTLTWSYTTANGVVSDRMTYRVNLPIPFAVSCEGVRSKLGLSDHELADGEIDLVRAYADFSSLFTSGVLMAYEASGDRASILCSDAIEAMAAISLVPGLSLRVAQRESSGTNTYQRFSTVDWNELTRSLNRYVDDARAVVDETFDGAAEGLTIFTLAPRSTDPFTG